MPPNGGGKGSELSTSKLLSIMVIGNLVEWIDWGVFGFITPILGKLFFPVQSPLIALASTFLIFGVGFLARPIGGIVWGYVGDKVGRRTAMLWAFILMALSSILTGLSPTFSQVGVIAPFFLVAFRLLQGLSVGGEFGGAISYLIENAGFSILRGRGFLSSMQQFSTLLSLLVGITVSIFFTSLPIDQVYSYGWRLAFIVPAALALPIGIYIRYKMPETPLYEKNKEENRVEKNPLAKVVKASWKRILLGIGMLVIGTLDFYIGITFMPSYLTTVLHYSLTQALSFVVFGIIIAASFVWIFGIISDKYGRRKIGIIGALWYIILTYPVFLIVNSGNTLNVIMAVTLLNFGIAPLSGATVAWIAELFPTTTRYSGFSLVVQVGVGLIGGFSPYIATLLISLTGNTFAPAYYVIAGAIISAIFMIVLPETYKEKLE
jgi:MHS family proline/betaine transporter-like MFS transporter